VTYIERFFALWRSATTGKFGSDNSPQRRAVGGLFQFRVLPTGRLTTDLGVQDGRHLMNHGGDHNIGHTREES
jgi:hypothetical protein